MDNNEVFDFGIRLKKLRQSKKMSQEELGKRLGVSKGTIYRYECNTQAISFETATKLAVTLGTSLDYLARLENATMIRVPNHPIDSHLITGQLVTKEHLGKILINCSCYTPEPGYS